MITRTLSILSRYTHEEHAEKQPFVSGSFWPKPEVASPLVRSSSRLKETSKRVAGLTCGDPQAFSLLRCDIHRETASNCAAFVMYLQHDPYG